MKGTIEKWNYMQSSNANYGVNSIVVEIGSLRVYFSYDTVVAYATYSEGLVMSENLWGPTTGRHMNHISRNAERLDRTEFEARFNNLMDTMERAITGTIAYNKSDIGVIVNSER